MKNFLKKMPVFITSIVVAVCLLVVYIAMLARPVAYGMAYTGKMDIAEANMKANYSFKIKNDKLADMIMEGNMFGGNATVKVKFEVWIVRNGNKIAMMGFKDADELGKQIIPADQFITEEEYKQMLAEAKADKESWDENWNSSEVLKINAFKMSGNNMMDSGEVINLTNTGTIVFACVMGVVIALVVAFAAVSTTFFVLGKKKSA